MQCDQSWEGFLGCIARIDFHKNQTSIISKDQNPNFIDDVYPIVW